MADRSFQLPVYFADKDLSVCDLSSHWSEMPIYTYLLTVFSTGVAKTWIVQRRLAGYKENQQLQTRWRAWLRPGAGLARGVYRILFEKEIWYLSKHYPVNSQYQTDYFFSGMVSTVILRMVSRASFTLKKRYTSGILPSIFSTDCIW